MSDRRLVLVTGASGFLGSHLCEALAARGDRVRALYRRATPPAELARLAGSVSAESGIEDGAVELFNADLGDAARVRRAVEGADAVVHAAALTSDWGDYGLFEENNVRVTRNLLEAAEAAGCASFVFISSAAVHGFGRHVDTTEEGPYFPLKYPYQLTKKEAEGMVLARDRPGFKTVAVRPCNVYGPGDRTSTYKMFSAILDGIFGYIGRGLAYTCPIYIDDLCSGTLAALDLPESAGQAILLADGEKVAWRDYVAAMYDAIGTDRRPLALPAPIAFAAARVMTFAARVARCRGAPPLTLYRVEQGSSHYHFSNGKARRLLGFEPRVLDREGLALTARAFLQDREAGG
jgi:nucleoside-diphosphate-sugar epimerase